MTLCRNCGHTSRPDDFCEGCRQPLRTGVPEAVSGAQPTLQMPPQPQQPVRRVALTGEVFESVQGPANGALPTLQMAPQTQTLQRVALKGEVVENTQAIPARQISGAPPGMHRGYAAGLPTQPYPGQPAGAEAMLPAAAYSARPKSSR